MKNIFKNPLNKSVLTVLSFASLVSFAFYLIFDIQNLSNYTRVENNILFILFFIFSSIVIALVNFGFSKNKITNLNFDFSRQFLYFSAKILLLGVFALIFESFKINYLSEFIILNAFLFFFFGINSLVLPIINVSNKLSNNWLKISFISSLFALISSAIVLVFELDIVYYLIYSILISFGIISYLKFIFESYKRRINNTMDVPIRFIYIANLNLLFIVFFLNFSFLPIEEDILKIELLKGAKSAFIYGVLTPFVFAYLIRSLSFNIWSLNIKTIKANKLNILPKDLYSRDLSNYAFSSYFFAFVLLLLGSLFAFEFMVIAGQGLMLVSLMLIVINVLKMARFKVR